MEDDSKYDEFDRFLRSGIVTETKEEEKTPAPSRARPASRAPAAYNPPPLARGHGKKALTLRKRKTRPSKRKLARAAGVVLIVLIIMAAVYYYMHIKIPTPQPNLSFEGSEIYVNASKGSGSLEIVLHNTGQASARIRAIYITDSSNNPVLDINFPDEHCGGLICIVIGGPVITGNILIVPPGAQVTVGRPYLDNIPFRPDVSYLVTVSTLDTADVQFVIQSKPIK